MAKKATPKRKQARSSTRSRYSSFQHFARKRLKNTVHLVDCENCKKKRLIHNLCPNCGFYRGRKIIQVGKIKKAIQTIKA